MMRLYREDGVKEVVIVGERVLATGGDITFCHRRPCIVFPVLQLPARFAILSACFDAENGERREGRRGGSDRR